MGITIGIVIVLVMIAMPVWLLYFGAKYEKQTSYVPNGEIKFVEEGGSHVKTIASLSGTGYHLDNNTGLIIAGEKKWNEAPHSILGVYYVSLLYPLREIHLYRYEWDKLVKGDTSKGEADYVIEHRAPEWVNSLYFLATYPILVERVELAGNLRINILVNITFRVVNPIIPVFVFKGKWFQQASASVKGAVANFPRGKTLDEFRALDKEGEDSSFSKEISKINLSSNGLPGVIETFGMAIHRVDFVGFDLVAASLEEQAATTAFEIARLEANADTEKARGLEAIGVARANVIGARLERAAKTVGGVSVLQQEIMAEGLANFKGSTLSLGERMPLAIIPK